MIEINNLYKSYGDLEVLKDINIRINEGEIYGIIGHSGGGKSTLLRCINGLETFQSGSVKVMNNEVSALKPKELREFRRDIGMIFQSFNLINRMSVFDNVALPLKVWKKDNIKKEVERLLNIVGLLDKANVKARNLSGGQKQRVAIARALALNPKILLCDEATSSLDPKTTKEILSLLLKVNQELKITIVVVTHEMEVIREICRRVALIDRGTVMEEGYAEKLFLRPGLSLKKFLGEEEEELLPRSGVNIKIYFPKEFAENHLITKMSRETNIDISIVLGKLEKFRENVLGNLVINIKESEKDIITDYLTNKEIQWEVLRSGI